MEILCILVIFSLALVVNRSNYAHPWDMEGNDISYEWQEAVKIGKGANPYVRILDGNLIINDKYATLLPLYYYFLSAVSKVSGTSFSDFIYSYRWVIQLFEYASFLIIYLMFRRNNQMTLGLFAASFFIFNRWTVASVATLKQDVVAITFLLSSIYLFTKYRRLSYLLYGVSLGVKHLGIFVAPLYLTPIFFKERSRKDFLLDMLMLIFPVLLPSIPFLIDNFKAFYYSMIFSFTRKPVGGDDNGYDKLLVNYSHMGDSIAMFYLTLPRLPLAVFTLANISLLFLKKIRVEIYLVFAFLVFAALNPVYFDQYLVWIIPFAVLAGMKKDSIKN